MLDPFWDMAPDGIALPLWLGILIVMLLAIIAPNIWWLYKYLVMRPVAGHGIAARAGNEKTQQALIFGMNRAFSIQALDYLEKVLSFKDPSRIARWLQSSPYAVGMLGYKSIMLLSEIFDMPKDPVAEMAILQACYAHNETVEKKNADDMITDYKSYRSHIKVLKNENLNGVELDIYRLYNPGQIHPFTPENRTSGQFGRTILKDANDLNIARPQASFWEKNGMVFLCIIFGALIIILTAYFTGTMGHATAPALPNVTLPKVV